jgi:hypothetical protein
MKENFEKMLHTMHEAAKRESAGESKEAVRKDLAEEIDRLYDEKVLPYGTEGDVYRLQMEKADIMGELHQKIRAIEDGESVAGFAEGESRDVEWNKGAHRAMVKLPSGKRAPATVGELVTDGAWGLAYKLGKDIPKDIKKRFIISEARRKILGLADEQIIRAEMAKRTIKEGGETNPSYRNIFEDTQKDNRTGVIAEKLVKTFFAKNIIDHELPIRFEEVDVHEDVERKIDFIVHLPRRARGVGVEEPEEREDVGIQLTTNITPEAHEWKAKQIEESKKRLSEDKSAVDDILLVTLPLKELNHQYNVWKKEEKRPGGPMRRWNGEQKKQIFKGVLQGLFSDEKLTEMWDQISKE